MFNFCPPFCLSELKAGAVNHLNFTVLHSISLFCTDLRLIDMLLTNQNAEIVACILLLKTGHIKTGHNNFTYSDSNQEHIGSYFYRKFEQTIATVTGLTRCVRTWSVIIIVIIIIIIIIIIIY